MVVFLVATGIVVLLALVLGYDLYKSRRLKKQLSEGSRVPGEPFDPDIDPSNSNAQITGFTHGISTGGYPGIGG